MYLDARCRARKQLTQQEKRRQDEVLKHITSLTRNEGHHRMPHGVEEDLCDGWTRVGYGKSCPPSYRGGFPPALRDLSIEALTLEFGVKLKVWRGSTCRKQLLAVLDKQRPDEGWALTNAICLASGSFSRDNFTVRQRSLTQFTAFLDIVKHLQSQQEEDPIAVFAQDPLFTPLDREHLQTQGIQVLDAEKYHDRRPSDRGVGEAGGYITTSTFIFEAYMERSETGVRSLLQPDPILYVGTCCNPGVGNKHQRLAHIRTAETIYNAPQGKPALSHNNRFVEDDIAEKLRMNELQEKFLRVRRDCYFPPFEEDPNMFKGMRVCWKGEKDEDEDEVVPVPRA
ncbi:hypothetical protein LTR62_003833 [Meristemomyces frigidus]|uniref:SRR1-like domain-containing protein n=1 Tax=Meristemomyces frigidus TaxID=1508187 RepID=A0AAN7TND3_9PEZI|nr:hypothetical protein LTR62_003833 [Meristemomyces frigidus]